MESEGSSMRRNIGFVSAFLCLALLLLPGRVQAALNKQAVEAAWRRVAIAGDMKDVPLRRRN